jgi:hypothetical protein
MRNGKLLALQALSGKATECIPIAVFNWEFDYIWKAAGIEPWKLATGGSESWHEAHLKLLDRHDADLIFFTGSFEGPLESTLIEEDANRWMIRNNNNGRLYGLTKNSYTLYDAETGAKGCNSVGMIETFADADRLVPTFKTDRLIPTFMGWGETYLKGLRRLIDEVGNRALILPHYSPAYVYSCYAFGFENAMCIMLTNPELFFYVCEMIKADHRRRMIELKEAGAQAVFIADGWASCDIISPAMFEKFALPYQIYIVEAAREAGLKVILWNEGNILPLLEKQASVQMDAFGCEQPRKGADLSVENLRKVFGKNRCLLGNLDSELLLMRNDTAEIREEVAKQLRQSGQNAPFIFSTGSPLPSNIEPNAVDKMIEAVRSFSI